MVKELERVLAEKEAEGDVDDDEREVIDGTAQEVVEDDNG
jgi:hypothetical protein